MPHSYGADFSGVGLWGPRNRESTRAPAPKPAPSTIRRTTNSRLSMLATLVKLFASFASCYRIRLADASRAGGVGKELLPTHPPANPIGRRRAAQADDRA